MMTVQRKHYVVFRSPGTMFTEESSREIKSWDTVEAVRLSREIQERHGARPYGFVFESRLTADPVDDGAGGTLKVEPKRVAQSGTHFLGGTVETYDEVCRRNATDEDILRRNMWGNGLWLIVTNHNSYRCTQPFGVRDMVVDDAGDMVCCGNEPEFVEYRKRKSVEREVE